jgi:hypothetical protein
MDKSTHKVSPGPVNTISNNTTPLTEGDLDRATAAKLGAAAEPAMSSENVTPIRPSAKMRRPRGPKIGLSLSESDEFAGFSSLDLLNGLNGVCVALDDYMVSGEGGGGGGNHACQLARAAMVLSAIVQDRLLVP